MTASSMDRLDGASGLMELFRGKNSAEVRSLTPPPKKRRLDSIPASAASAPQPKARPSSTFNGPVAKPLSDSPASVCSTPVANTLSLVPSFGGWSFALQPLQNTYVSPMVFMPAATPALAQLAQNLAQSGMAYGTSFSPQCRTPSQAWQQQTQQQQAQQQQQQQALPVPRAPAVQQRPRGAYPAAGQNCQIAARWQASLHALLSRGDLAENNHRLLDPISKCDVWEVPSKVLRLPPRQVDVLHPEVRSLVVQFQRDLASTKPAAVYKAQLHAHAMQELHGVLNAVRVLAGQQG